MTLHQVGALPAAEAAYRGVLAASPRHAATMTLLATVLAQNGQPKEAVRLFDTSLKFDRNQELALFNRGNALFELRRNADALASYNRAVALWPGHAPLLNNRGNALLALGRRLEALASFDRAIAAAPDFADAHFNRANALRELERYAEAEGSYRKALSLQPDHAEAHHNLAYTLLLTGFHRGGGRFRRNGGSHRLPRPGHQRGYLGRHLAAALGKPVWLLNRFDTCWRWLLQRDDSPWYPQLRQFRQPRPGDWASVIRGVREALLRRVADCAADRDRKPA